VNEFEAQAKRVAALLDRAGAGGDPKSTEQVLLPELISALDVMWTEKAAYLQLTEEALQATRLLGDSASAAREVLRGYLVNQFFDRLLLTVSWNAGVELAKFLIDGSELEKLGSRGPRILCSMHLSRYLLMGAYLHAVSPFEIAFLKARQDVMEQEGGRDKLLSDGEREKLLSRAIYTTDRASPLLISRVVRAGGFVSMPVDHVHTAGQVDTISFFGSAMHVNLGAAWIAQRAGVPLVPIGLVPNGDRLALRVLDDILPGDDPTRTMQEVYSAFEGLLRDCPSGWGRWFTAFADDRELELRPRLRQANQMIWDAVLRYQGNGA